MESLETNATSSTNAQGLLEWILFTPSPVTSILQSQLSTVDVIRLSRVCRKWRAHLIPHFLKTTTEDEVEWHPLVRTLAVARLTAQQEKHCFVYRGMRGRLYTGEDVKRDRSFSRIDSGINLTLFSRCFGNDYLRAITRIYLDGARIRRYSTDNMKLAWVRKCKSLVFLSLRWCISINVNDLSWVLLAEEQGDSESTDSDRLSDRDTIPPKLHTLMIWGVSGVWGTSKSWGRMKNDHEICDKLMETYKTDLEWCSGLPHSGDDWKVKRALDAATLVCTVCSKAQKAKCLDCELQNTCEGCGGYICDQCLSLKPMVPVDGYYKNSFSEHIRGTGPSPPNMLVYFCTNWGSCRWRNTSHYFHPSCVPFTSTLAPNDNKSQRICLGCAVYICTYGTKLCQTCGAGVGCCSYPHSDDPQACCNCRKNTDQEQTSASKLPDLS
ncbi:hypothetical protein TWF506_009360 [Arthrobotrys conoides]|uniref:F-box domain-containing protein n=1 Tax=Arthrobotrys conoides TaxID=74498 RepID=A0AAN8NMF9_9PEZI